LSKSPNLDRLFCPKVPNNAHQYSQTHSQPALPLTIDKCFINLYYDIINHFCALVNNIDEGNIKMEI